MDCEICNPGHVGPCCNLRSVFVHGDSCVSQMGDEGMKIIDYTAVRGAVWSELEKKVLEKISEGWQPYGDVAVDVDGPWYFRQVMVRYDDGTNSPGVC